MLKRNGSTSTAAIRALQKELYDLHKEPLEGFVVEPEQKDIFKWRVGIYGPPETIYQGGYFKAELRFPADYPLSPPTMRFLSPMWHPNIYKDGKVCISILHPPINDEMSGELPEERWLPTQSVRTVLLSVVSLLTEPNISSPANVDASVAYRKWKEAGVKDFETRVTELVQESRERAELEGITVPNTVGDYCVKAKKQPADEWGEEEEDGYYEALSTDSDEDYEEEEEEEGENECGEGASPDDEADE